MEAITSSEEIVKLLGMSGVKHPEDIIPYKLCFPHEYIPGTIISTERYINFDLKASMDFRNNVYKDVTIWFFVLCHKDVVQYEEEGRTYLWYDKVACELDSIFTDNQILGVGKTVLVNNVPYCPQQEFKGRLLTFTVKDFSNGALYGK